MTPCFSSLSAPSQLCSLQPISSSVSRGSLGPALPAAPDLCMQMVPQQGTHTQEGCSPQALTRVLVRLFAVGNRRGARGCRGLGRSLQPWLLVFVLPFFFWWQDLPASRAQPESAAGHRGEGVLGPGQDREDQGQQESHQGSKRVALFSGWLVVPKVLFFPLSPCL